MRHSFTPHFRLNNFNTALFTDNPAMLHAFIFSAITLIVLGGAKDFCTEKTIPFRLECPVVYGFRFFDFTMRPLSDLV